MRKEFTIITDIGSTTTKAILLKLENTGYKLIDHVNTYTTVESPFEDVKIGIYKAIKQLEENNNFRFFNNDASESNLSFPDNVSYYTTSSAGGGLQILVVGLTLVESASSAERAAYGVGGVLLDTLAIDDNRSVIEKMHLLNTLHPDIILFCGGVDSGALFSVYRLAEILNLSSPVQKFSETGKLPLVYAGNKDATDFITTIFKDKFDLHTVANLRPTMKEENLGPATDKIHDLFMDSVMEQAPGYSSLKKVTNYDIIPTPKGVLNSLQILSKSFKTILAFDIGGATTDVFSNVNGVFNRTVSGNYGMSYSLGNVLACSDDGVVSDFLKHYFNSDFEQVYTDFLNYTGNKVLYPEFVPKNQLSYFFEHILAIQAIQLSKEQHYKMHFKIKRIGFLDKLKEMASRDKFKETMYYPHYDESFIFSNENIDLIIGAGGVIANASKKQAIFIISESINPKGVTMIARDKHFITPHLGVLSEVDELTAEELLKNECLENLATYIKVNYVKYKKNSVCMRVSNNQKNYDIMTDDLIVIEDLSMNDFNISIDKSIINEIPDFEIIDKKILIIDTRPNDSNKKLLLLEKLKPYQFDENPSMSEFSNNNEIITDFNDHILSLSLPYKGELLVSAGDNVKPDILLGQNKFDPPKIYVILLSAMLNRVPDTEEVKRNLLISVNDIVGLGTKIYSDHGGHNLLSNKVLYSPVRGIVEKINFETGTIVLREIQDYPEKPMTVNVAKQLKIKEKHIKAFMKKREGDFIYAGETLASNNGSNFFILSSPYTGTVKEVNTKTGTVKICYDKKPYQVYAQSYGKVIEISDDKRIKLLCNTILVSGKIGFGRDIGGAPVFLDLLSNEAELSNKIVFFNGVVDMNVLSHFANQSISGLVCSSINYKDVKMFLGKDIGVALTGNEDIPFSIIIINDFSVETPKRQFTVLYDRLKETKLKHNYVLLKPHTQIRAGASRPGIYLF